MKKLLAFAVLTLVLIFMTSCSTHEHAFENYVQTEPTCGETGTMKCTCTKCDYYTFEKIPATREHIFGSWTQSSPTSMFRTCTICNEVETSTLVNDGALDNSTHSYTTFLSFKEDCLVNGSTLKYNGQSNKILISLSSGNSTDSCENKTIVIPARVTDVQFIGLATGSPLSNLRIDFEERVNDINVSFNDVRIESTSKIITSTSRNISFNIKMFGNTCSFINTSKGYDGEDGEDGATNDTERVFGKNGQDGSCAFEINGNVTIYSQASLLEIKGGDGGNGGDGGHIATSSAPSGGDGGNGGNAILGEELVTVYVSANCTANIVGGAGGAGGAGGKSDIGYWGSNKNGPSGAPGASGISGCTIIFN